VGASIQGGKSYSVQSEQCCTELSSCPVATLESSEARSLIYDRNLASVSCPCSWSTGFLGRFAAKIPEDGTTRWRLCLTEDVPVLWTHYAAPRSGVPGMRQAIQTSLKSGTVRPPRRTVLVSPEMMISVSLAILRELSNCDRKAKR
jgi:hypothetical protein